MTQDKNHPPQSTVDAEAVIERIEQRVAAFRDTSPEEDETWESWYFAAFDLLSAEVSALSASSREGESRG